MPRHVGVHWLAGVAAVAASCLPAALARADEPVSLAWEAPAECPDKSQVEAAIRAWLDQPGSTMPPSAVRVEATVRPASNGWELDLTLTAPGGSEHQSLLAARCETLMQIVALKVALAADPATLVRSLESARAVPPPAASPQFAVRGLVGGGVGPLPDVSGFAMLGASAEMSGWRLEVAAAAWLPRSAVYTELPTVGATFTLLTGGARGCILTARGAVDFPICAGAEMGVLRGSGFGVPQVETSNQLWAAAVIGPGLRWTPGSSTSLLVGADAVVGIARPAFHMRNLEQLYRPDAVAARAWSGLELRW